MDHGRNPMKEESPVNRFFLCLVSVICFAAPAYAGETAQEAFEEAFFLENGEGAFARAAARYEEILATHPQERAIVSKAALRLGLCHEKLGKLAHARSSFERVIREYPEQGAHAQAALARLDRAAAKKKTPNAAAADELPPALEALIAQKVTVNFEGVPLRDAVAFLVDMTGTNIVVDHVVKNVSVDLRLREVSLKIVLGMIAKLDQLAFTVVHDVVMLTTPERLHELSLQTWPTVTDLRDPLDKSTLTKMSNQSVSLNFSGTGVEDVLDFLRAIGQLNIVVSSAAKAHLQSLNAGVVKLRVRDVSVETSLRLVLITNGLAYRLEGGVVVVELSVGTQTRAEDRTGAGAPR